MIKNYFLFIVLCFSTIYLPNSYAAAKARKFSRTYAVCQLRYWSPFGQHGTYLAIPGKQCYGYNFTPTIEQFNKNPRFWMDWTGSMIFGQVKILGMVTAANHYRLDKVVDGYERHDSYLTLLDGPLAEKQVIAGRL